MEIINRIDNEEKDTSLIDKKGSIQVKLKCIIRAIDETVKEANTNVAEIWKEAKQQLEYGLIRMKACRTEQTISDELK